MTTPDPVAIGEEIDSLIARLRSSGSASAEARRLVQLVLSLHGAGLSRLLELIRDNGGGEALLRQLASDPLVASLLALHELQPRPRGEQLLQITRPSTAEAHGEGTTRAERCELCAAALSTTHAHLVDIETRRLLCACTICSAVGGKYRLVPSRFVHQPSMTITPAEWDPLGIPVGLVFFVVNSHLERTVACYPGPAGATESVLPLEAWPALSARHTWLQRLAPDVEALLVRRSGDDYRCFIVPLDACYELVGRIRKAWTGCGGGDSMDREIDRFFSDVLRKAEQHVEVLA
jgi:hypothetical protein